MNATNPRLVEVNPNNEIHLLGLFLLLKERTPEQSISHKRMPLFEEHRSFVKSKPYRHWFLIEVDDPRFGPSFAGSVYLTYDNEIGIFTYESYSGQGHAKWAVEQLMAAYPGPFLANINPKNARSIAFFQKLGFGLIQHTYSHE